MRRREAAFTLLEVLAAVALLGILYTVLADVAMQGLRGEGVARRHLEASLLIDRRLSDLERDLAAGFAPPLGLSEDEEGPFRISTDVQPFEPPEGFLDPAPTGRAPASLFVQGPRTPAAVRTIELRVAWDEGNEEESVQRTTFAYDPGAVAAVAAQPGANGS